MPWKIRPKGRGGPTAREHPVDPVQMASVCRKLASDLRAEDAAGWGPITTLLEGQVTRVRAAWLLDKQAERWAEEARTGEPNRIDRDRIGA